MSNFSDDVADEVIAHTLDLFRFDSGERLKVLALLNGMKEEVSYKLSRMNADQISGAVRVKRMKAIIKEIEEVIRQYYRDMWLQSNASLTDLANVEAAFAASSINTAATVNLITDYKLTKAFVRSLVSDVLIEGAPSKEWWGRQATGTLDRFKDAIRMGVALGESNNKLIQRVIGRPTGKTTQVRMASGEIRTIPVYDGGVVETSRQHAASLVRSSVQAISNAARAEVYERNSDIIMGLQALVVLDGRTSKICMARSGAVWSLEGEPLQGVDYPLPGRPPWHWNCRTILIPILRSWQDIENVRTIKLAPPGATQASMDGQVAADLTYETWLESKPADFQLKVLGRSRFNLWKSGKLRLRDLVDQYNRVFTVKQLEAKLAA